MVRYRPTLSEAEAQIVVVALRQYAAGRVSPERKETANRLIDRLIDRQVGNPQMLYGKPTAGTGLRKGTQPD